MLLRTTLAAGLAVVVTIAGATVPAHAASPRYDRTSALEARRVDRVDPRLDWVTCFEIAECATATVPLDYDEPRGPQTRLAVLRVKARDQSRKIGSLFVNPGGPGGSATQMALAAGTALSDEMLDRFDIVGVDPRGIAGSQNVRCWRTEAEREADLRGSYVSFPMGRAEERAYVAAAERVGRACSTTGRPLAGAMSTAEVARDMDVIRRAVGDRALTYFGFSYGSELGQTYANIFPDRVRAIAVDGVIDPVAWAGVRTGRHQILDERMRSSDGAYRALREILRRCDAAGENRCAFAAGDPTREWERITRELRRQPLEVETPDGTYTITYADFVAQALGTLYYEDAGEQVTHLAAEVRAGLSDRAGMRREDPPYDNSYEAGSGVICTDTIEPDEAAAWIPAGERSDRRASYFGRLWGWWTSACARDTWTVRDEDAYLGPFDRRTAEPLLYIGNFWDPATNYDASLSASARMPGARQVSSNNWGHAAYLTAPCITGHIDQYLLNGKLPARGTVCTDARQPFTEPMHTIRKQRTLMPATPKPRPVLDPRKG